MKKYAETLRKIDDPKNGTLKKLRDLQRRIDFESSMKRETSSGMHSQVTASD